MGIFWEINLFEGGADMTGKLKISLLCLPVFIALDYCVQRLIDILSEKLEAFYGVKAETSGHAVSDDIDGMDSAMDLAGGAALGSPVDSTGDSACDVTGNIGRNIAGEKSVAWAAPGPPSTVPVHGAEGAGRQSADVPSGVDEGVGEEGVRNTPEERNEEGMGIWRHAYYIPLIKRTLRAFLGIALLFGVMKLWGIDMGRARSLCINVGGLLCALLVWEFAKTAIDRRIQEEMPEGDEDMDQGGAGGSRKGTVLILLKKGLAVILIGMALDDSAMIMRIKFKCIPGEQFVLRREVFRRVKEEFREHGIAFAHRNVTVYLPHEERRHDAPEKGAAPPQAGGDSSGSDRMRRLAAGAAAMALNQEKKEQQEASAPA